MSARTKIALLITAAGLFAALFFSAFSLWKMLDDQFDLIDESMDRLAKRALAMGGAAAAGDPAALHWLENTPYWLVVREAASGRVLFRSTQARSYDLPEMPTRKATLRRVPVPDGIDIDRDDQGRADFRALCRFSDSGVRRACVAWPLDDLQEEFWESVGEVAMGLAAFLVVLLGASCVAAGFILRPLAALDRQAREISEANLERRLPLTDANDEFNALAATLNRVFDRLENAFARQKRLIADAAHELKTPLAVMRLTLHNAETGAEGEPDERTGSGLLAQVLRMERLVKSLLDLSILEAGDGIRREWVDLREILASLAADYRLLAENGGIALHAELPERLTVSGDADKLYRAFSNLLDNAVKYNAPEGEIRLAARAAGGRVEVVIVNTGPALPEDEVTRIFEPFYRVDKSRARELGGAGLGLAIVKRIIDLHGGGVTIRSAAEGRIEVRVTLPAN